MVLQLNSINKLERTGLHPKTNTITHSLALSPPRQMQVQVVVLNQARW